MCISEKSVRLTFHKTFLGAPVDWSCLTKEAQVVNKAKLLEYKRSVNFGTGIN